jgi:hypothetical protein
VANHGPTEGILALLTCGDKRTLLGDYSSHGHKQENLRNVFLSAVNRVWLRNYRHQKTHEVFARTASLCLHTQQQGHMDCDICTPAYGIRDT